MKLQEVLDDLEKVLASEGLTDPKFIEVKTRLVPYEGQTVEVYDFHLQGQNGMATYRPHMTATPLTPVTMLTKVFSTTVVNTFPNMFATEEGTVEL